MKKLHKWKNILLPILVYVLINIFFTKIITNSNVNVLIYFIILLALIISFFISKFVSPKLYTISLVKKYFQENRFLKIMFRLLIWIIVFTILLETSRLIMIITSN